MHRLHMQTIAITKAMATIEERIVPTMSPVVGAFPTSFVLWFWFWLATPILVGPTVGVRDGDVVVELAPTVGTTGEEARGPATGLPVGADIGACDGALVVG